MPEVEDDTVIQISGNKLWDEYNEAKALGIETKPTVTGAYTMLKLCRYTGSKTEADYVDAIVNAYQQILAKCDASGITWVQFEEPALVWDMDENDISLFHKIYDELLAAKKSCKVLIQTYFGDVRDVYRNLIAMPFDGIGLDFIEGKQTFDLIEKNGFPEDKILFAGLVNGKNILRLPRRNWKNFGN